MPFFSVLLHIEEKPYQLGRLLETLRPADEVLVVDHSHDAAIRKVAHQYGAKLVPSVPGVDLGGYALHCKHDWVLCMQAMESLSEALEAALFEWKRTQPEPINSFSVPVREQNHGQWRLLDPETRLVNRCSVHWQGKLPPTMTTATALTGYLLRFLDPE